MLRIKQVTKSMTNRRMFRTLARDNCGESMEPGENEIVYFGYEPHNLKMQGTPIACGSLCFADPLITEVENESYYHTITFLFVHRDFKRRGFGRQLLSYMETDAFNHQERNIRVESAYKAFEFFAKCGYKQIADEKECIAGSHFFRFLYLMEKPKPVHHEELWVD